MHISSILIINSTDLQSVLHIKYIILDISKTSKTSNRTCYSLTLYNYVVRLFNKVY